MNRTSKRLKCPICHSDHWCLISEDGSACICMRVASSKVIPMSDGSEGWLHRLTDAAPKPYRKPEPAPTINADAMWRDWRGTTRMGSVADFAASLGVDDCALWMTGCAWASPHSAWAWPMRDEAGDIVGIRLRNEQGDKWAVKGSHSGLIVPEVKPQKWLWVCEGPTDTAAASSLGLHAIGRPSCMGCESHVGKLIERQRIARVVIVADNDGPGQRGAVRLQESLRVPSMIWTPPCKDIRELVQLGGDARMIYGAVENMAWTMPEKGTR